MNTVMETGMKKGTLANGWNPSPKKDYHMIITSLLLYPAP
jgi:hypothetical protein